MSELEMLSRNVARRFLNAHRDLVDERSRLFQDLQQFALAALRAARYRPVLRPAVRFCVTAPAESPSA
jgi:hypothetical protein